MVCRQVQQLVRLNQGINLYVLHKKPEACYPHAEEGIDLVLESALLPFLQLKLLDDWVIVVRAEGRGVADVNPKVNIQDLEPLPGVVKTMLAINTR